MSTTCNDLVEETLGYLYAGSRDPYNKLESGVNASVTTLALTYELGAAQAGSVLSIDLELVYVWEVNSSSSRSLTVERGYLGSTAATHATGAFVTINPKFSPFDVFKALNADLDDLSANGLFQVITDTFSYSSAFQGYDLDNDLEILEILQVKYDESGPARLWPEIKSYKLRRTSDTGDFASGNAIVVYQPGQDGSDIRVTYAAPFVPFTDLTDDIADTGLPATAHDIPPLGAAYRLQSMREPQRNFNESQPAVRRGQEVGGGMQLQAAMGYRQIRRDRIKVEASRLRKFWPNRRRVPA